MASIVWKCVLWKVAHSHLYWLEHSFHCPSFFFCLCLAQGLSLCVWGCFRRRLCSYLLPHQCLCVSLAPVALSSGPHNPQETVVSFFTVTGCGPRRVAPGLQTNSVWLESLCFFFVFAANDHRPCFLQEPRQRNGLSSDSVCSRHTEEDQTPSWAKKKAEAER